MKQNSLPLQVADFVVTFGDGLYSHGDHPYIEKVVGIHLEYGTLMVMKDKGEIIAVARWNQPSESHVTILDLIVHPDYRNKNIAKEMFKRAKMAMPALLTVSFKRQKYAGRERVYLISRWLKENLWAEVQNPR